MDQFPKIEIKDLKLYAIWSWKTSDLNAPCAICKKEFRQHCFECETQMLQHAEEVRKCDIAQGQCGHIFHRHCIENWVKEKSGGGIDYQCGLCAQNWDIRNQTIMEV